MERRRHGRSQLQKRATLESPETGSVLATVRNIGIGGMFVETGSVVLPLHAKVTVSFSLPLGKTPYGFRLKAIVIRRTRTGAGLMFLPMDAEVAPALSQALARLAEDGKA